jgi:signal transduction histidine kinase
VPSVEYTGPGFDNGDVTFDPTSALANIRERLEACGSELVITAREGGVTVATIRVPMQECVSGER